MIYKIKNNFFCGLLLICSLATSGVAQNQDSKKQWQNPFESSESVVHSGSDSLTVGQILDLVAAANPALKAGLKRIEAADGLLTQAGLWSNPELEIGFEDVGWDSPGLSESEITVMLSQEIELWGNRSNRKKVARRELETIQLETQITAFDLYATTKERFYTLGHAQRRVALAQNGVDLAAGVVKSARIRVDMGAAMHSELLLGQLEMETASLELAEATSELDIAKAELTSLWLGTKADIVAAETKFDPAVVANINALQSLLEGSRGVRTLEAAVMLSEAKLNLKRSEGKPNLSLRGGYKRIEADGSNSFLFGVGFPLPFMNRNQGNIKSLQSRQDALNFMRQQALVTARAKFQTSKRRIEQKISRYSMVNTRVLPKAEETYISLKSAYDKGKMPYSILLEAQRLLLDLRFELNDIGLSIKQEIVSLERLLGVTIR